MECVCDLTSDLFVSCIDQKSPDYNIPENLWLTEQLTIDRLAKVLADVNTMDYFYRPLSELVLQRKITDKDDLLELALEVEAEIWKHGRKLRENFLRKKRIKAEAERIKLEAESRTSG